MASRRNRAPAIALLSDFGSVDYYAAAMKGVILSRLPSAVILDIAHDLEPGNIRQASYVLWAVHRFLPEKCVCLAVVDPGVGSERPILIAAIGGRIFLAPDNGLLDPTLSDAPKFRVFRLSLAKAKPLLPASVSPTFHGRDIFAPVACALASGRSPATLGKQLRSFKAPEWKVSGPYSKAQPAILSVDRFGNIITNIVAGDSRSLRNSIRTVSVGNVMISVVVGHFLQAMENTPCMLAGSSGLLEIVVKNGSAASMLRATDRSAVRIFWAGERQ